MKRILAILGVVLLVGLAGCSGILGGEETPSDTPTPEPYADSLTISQLVETQDERIAEGGYSVRINEDRFAYNDSIDRSTVYEYRSNNDHTFERERTIIHSEDSENDDLAPMVSEEQWYVTPDAANYYTESADGEETVEQRDSYNSLQSEHNIDAWVALSALDEHTEGSLDNMESAGVEDHRGVSVTRYETEVRFNNDTSTRGTANVELLVTSDGVIRSAVVSWEIQDGPVPDELEYQSYSLEYEFYGQSGTPAEPSWLADE